LLAEQASSPCLLSKQAVLACLPTRPRQASNLVHRRATPLIKSQERIVLPFSFSDNKKTVFLNKIK